MFEINYLDYFVEKVEKVAKCAVVCVPMIVSPPIALAAETRISVCEKLTAEGHRISKIAQLADWYKLTPMEVERLKSLLEDYEPHEQDAALREEVRSIIETREFEAQITPEIVERAREAFESGRTGFRPQQVD